MIGQFPNKAITQSRCRAAARTKMGNLPRWVGAGNRSEYMTALDVDRQTAGRWEPAFNSVRWSYPVGLRAGIKPGHPAFIMIALVLALLLCGAPSLAAITDPFVTINGQVAPLQSEPCPVVGYTACYTFPIGSYGPLTVMGVGALRVPTLLFYDGTATDLLTLTGVAIAGPAGSTAVVVYGGTYTQGVPGTYLYNVRAVGSFEKPTTGFPVTVQGSGCFTGECLPMPFLTVTPFLIGGTNFSQGTNGPQYCNVGGVCGNTLINTLTVIFQEDNTVRMPGSLEEESTLVTAVPEPSSLWLLGTGLLLLAFALLTPFFREAAKWKDRFRRQYLVGMVIVASGAGGAVLLMWP
jgi:hypothetical protein